MARKNIFEILKDSYKISKEMNKIEDILSSKLIYYYSDEYWDTTVQRFSLEELFDTEVLPKWKQRGTFLNHGEIREVLGINDTFTEETPVDKIILCLEYYYNILHLVLIKFDLKHKREYKYDNNKIKLVIENMNSLVEYLHYKVYHIDEEEKVILITKNPAATAVAEISTKNTAIAILQYHHASLEGNLDEKRKLLIAISHEYETLLKNPINGFSDYFKKANEMLNNLNIRHNNTTGKNKKDLLINMPNAELEKWYDELYQLLLFCVLIKDNAKRKKDVEQFLTRVNTSKSIISPSNK